MTRATSELQLIGCINELVLETELGNIIVKIYCLKAGNGIYGIMNVKREHSLKGTLSNFEPKQETLLVRTHDPCVSLTLMIFPQKVTGR